MLRLSEADQCEFGSPNNHFASVRTTREAKRTEATGRNAAVAAIRGKSHSATMSSYEWRDAPPTTAQRIVAGAYVAILLGALANNYFEWRLFGDYGKQFSAIWTMAGLILFVRFMPGVRRAG